MNRIISMNHHPRYQHELESSDAVSNFGKHMQWYLGKYGRKALSDLFTLHGNDVRAIMADLADLYEIETSEASRDTLTEALTDAGFGSAGPM